MKKLALIITGVGFIVGSCNKSLLNTTPTDRYVESTFWVTPEAANAGLIACYSSLRSNGVFGAAAASSLPLFEETASPNAYSYGNDQGYNSIANGQQQATTGGVIANRWGACYGGIGRCN